MAESAPPSEATNKVAAQLKKLSDANAKYKNLLKLAKERIQQQEEELKGLRDEKQALEDRLQSEEKDASGSILIEEGSDKAENTESSVIRICQRVKVNAGDNEEIWALAEIEVTSNEMTDTFQPPRRYKEWKRFDTEAQLQDFIRRDTGEPLSLPPYSLSPDQSARILGESDVRVNKVTEEFRRFRVRSELARKQADAMIRDLQSNNARKAARQIEGEQPADSEKTRVVAGEMERMKAELASQEAHWKEAYETLLAENNALKSAGSEALLASQWRQRYESCQQEKDTLQSSLDALKADQNAGADKYEAKYRDLKESFRLYRKKAKEIFESQQQQLPGDNGSPPNMGGISSNSSADAKLSYLKNLMLNYLTADSTMKDHMQGAISTILQFSPDEVSLIEKKKAEAEAWF